MSNGFAFRIRNLRISLGMTQTELAQALETTQAALSAYEKGDRLPSFEILNAIATKYNVSIDWLCGLSDKKNNRIETYSDLFDTLFMIEQSACLRFETISHEGVRMGPGWEPEPYIEYLQSIYFDNSKICSFLEEWEKMKTLHDNGTIDSDVYSLWIEKTLKKEDNSKVLLNGNRYELIPPDEGLPFEEKPPTTK